MGLFDLFEDIVEGVTETVVRLPELPVRTVKGVMKGVETGIAKVEKVFDFDND